MKITYYAPNSSMGYMSDTNCNLYREWAEKELLLAYPTHEVTVSDKESLSQTVTNDAENENEIKDFCRNLWDRCPWDFKVEDENIVVRHIVRNGKEVLSVEGASLCGRPYATDGWFILRKRSSTVAIVPTVNGDDWEELVIDERTEPEVEQYWAELDEKPHELAAVVRQYINSWNSN